VSRIFCHWAVQQHAAFHDVGDALIDRFIHGHLPIVSARRSAGERARTSTLH
jgi:hypothetical protein